MTPKELIELIKSLPDAEQHIFTDEDGVNVTTEWLMGTFAGRSFTGDTAEDAAQKMIDYFDEQLSCKSIVGDCVRKSGYPNVERMKNYFKEE